MGLFSPVNTMIISLRTLRDSVPLVQFKKREKDPWRNDTFIKVADWSLQRYWEYHSSVRVFHVFKIVQMTPNSAKHHRANYKKKDVKISKNVKIKNPYFWQNYHWTENDDSTRESK